MRPPDDIRRRAARAWLIAVVAAVAFSSPALPAMAPLGAAPAEAAVKRRVPWRPRWWPAAMPAGTGRAGVVIRISQQRLYVHDGRKGWTWFYVSTGAGFGTPRGWYRIVSKVPQPSWTYRGIHVPGGVPENPLGVYWLGLGMPATWRGAPVGIHGTNTPWVIGRPVTRGCIRLRNRDVLRLSRMVPVGTPVWILP